MLEDGKEVEILVDGEKLVVYHNPTYELVMAEKWEDVKIIIHPRLNNKGEAISIGDDITV
jgi:hypothetical protein